MRQAAPQGYRFSLLGIIAFVLILAAVGLVLLAIIGQASGIALLSKPCIAEVRIDDYITEYKEEASIFSAEPRPTSGQIISQIEEANRRPDVKAIVLYIDSPGGEVIASREIYEAAKKSDKPVVAYLRNVAASGAYYAAVGSDYIVSEPEAITGSIGVRATFVSLEGLFDKLGINYTVVASGDKKGMGDIDRQLTPEEREIVQAYVDEVFADFRQAVYESRKGNPRFTDERFGQALDARILSGRMAYSLGLVDEIGSRKAAFRKAADLAGVEEYGECTLSGQGGLLEAFMESARGTVNVNINIAPQLPGRAASVSYT
ncbi:MAG: signal peptide peptidase SppA [Candidatus Micrarchaeota archaeon]|nr:signal peptide peptidase SppA [Candidatus Micrarchaeota archaeon]